MAALLEAAPDLALAVDGHGDTPFHRAAAHHNGAVLQLLLEKATAGAWGANLSGRRPLHFAVERPGQSVSPCEAFWQCE